MCVHVHRLVEIILRRYYETFLWLLTERRLQFAGMRV